jgi:chondroitin 4-sulfotransferase 11
MINFIRQLLFLHIPKTGGTTIKNHLRTFRGNIPMPIHPHILDYVNRFPETLEFFKFCVVRNPWDLVVSRYFYRKQIIENRGNSSQVNNPNASFTEFVTDEDLYMESFKTWVNKDSEAFRLYDERKSFGAQYDLISDGDENILMDKILRYENFEDEVRELLLSFGISQIRDLHLNKSNHVDYKIYYTDQTRNIIANRFEKDIDYFKYTF